MELPVHLQAIEAETDVVYESCTLEEFLAYVESGQAAQEYDAAMARSMQWMDELF